MSKEIEEILYKVHELGIFEEFMNLVKEIREQTPFIERLEAYEKAFQKLLKK
jgi:hypothetical protein